MADGRPPRLRLNASKTFTPLASSTAIYACVLLSEYPKRYRKALELLMIPFFISLLRSSTPADSISHQFCSVSICATFLADNKGLCQDVLATTGAKREAINMGNLILSLLKL